MNSPPDLNELLAALRHHGIPVALTEVARLHAAFQAAPHLDRDALRDLLRCLLVKKPEQQTLFDPLFDTWCPQLEAQWGDAPAAKAAKRSTSKEQAQTGKQAGKPGTHDDTPPESDPTPKDPLRRRLSLAIVAAACALLALVAALLAPDPTPEVQPPPQEQPAQLRPKDSPGSRELPADPAPSVRYWRITDIQVSPPSGLYPAIPALLALFAALLAWVLWLRYRRKAHPPILERKVQPGPEWLPLPGVSGSDTRLLAARERRDLVWSIAHFSSEDQTRRVDEPATVAATVAAGGFTQIHYQHARYPREVWLWLDEYSRDPALTKLSDEISNDLRRSALACRRGSFAGTPTRVWWSRDDYVQPGRLEGHRAHALVALLTDGEALRQALRSATERTRLQTLLRQLRLWPRLVVVDFGNGRSLARLLRPYGLEVIAPNQLAAWLGGQPPAAARAANEPLVGELRLWAAACCLGLEPPDADTALRLARRLGLSATPWRLRALYRNAGNQQLRWPPPRRRELINWLLRSSARDAGGAPAPGSPARRAIDWWRERYRQASAREHRRQSRLWPWQGTPAEGRRALEHQLLSLYLDPRAAATGLRTLARSDKQLAAELKQRLAGFRAADQSDADTSHDSIRVGWRLADQAVVTQDALAELGFGGAALGSRRRGIAPAPRLALALGLIAGLALAATAAGLRLWLTAPATTLVHHPEILAQPTMAAQTLHLAAGDRLVLGHALDARSVSAPPGSEVRVDWRWGAGEVDGQAATNNPVRLSDGDDDALVFRAGALAQAIRPCIPDWPKRSLAIVQASPGKKDARQLAIRLLDSGTADRVLITPEWPERLAEFSGDDALLNAHTRLLIVVPPNTAATSAIVAATTRHEQAECGSAIPGSPSCTPPLPGNSRGPSDIMTKATAATTPGPAQFQAAAVVSADYHELAVWLNSPRRPDPDYRPHPDLATAPAVKVIQRKGAMRWHRGPEQTLDPRTGITWVRVCPGTFTMGSAQQDIDRPSGDPTKADSDEGPAHTVVLSGFEIAQTETSNAQYRGWPGDGQEQAPREHETDKAGELAAVNLDWRQARDYCAWAGGKGNNGDLPTEAQWEYAARGGSTGAWSFGDDDKRLADHAWFDEESKGNVHAVAGKDPNPLGLFDMHGNAWEWVRDRYGDYGRTAELDPEGPDSGVLRVLRGGSFWLSPRFLRSADRRDDLPEDWNRFVGFRCVRVPARQP